MNTAIDMGGNDINNARAVTATSDITSKDGWYRSQNDTGWVNEKWGGGIYQSDADWVRVLNDKGLLSGGKIRGGTLQADGRVTVGEYLDIESTAVEGQACPKIGIQSKNNLGAPLTCQCLTPSCQSGVWRGGATGSFKEFNNYELLVALLASKSRVQVLGVLALRVQQHTCLARPFSGLSGTRPSLAATQSIKCIVLPIRGVARCDSKGRRCMWFFLGRPL
ncbi:shufflon system plasmid conjugative transfer pilus tip adhesin PilV [Pseudomonas sp. FP833]|uniref:shufflon system plasmid conjugative transfer pilus tip adhesin PilV n=1 Tax=Pseudomonas sp. FP833 TaxID=2954102 RepID=UPI00351F675F